MHSPISGHHYINGSWKHGEGIPFTSINPANGEILWKGHHATLSEITTACDAAHDALTGWARCDQATRTNHIKQFGCAIEKNRKLLTELIAKESGKPLWEATTEVNSVIGKISLSIQSHQERLCEQVSQHNGTTNHLRYKPHGVVIVLGPFNFPAHLSNGHIIPALLAGNTMIYKPSELTPAVAELIMTCWHDSGIPAGVIQCVQGDVSVAKPLLQQDIQGVYFTGSYQTGLQINQSFSHRPEVILALEMGGNNPLLIDTVDDIRVAVYHTLLSCFLTAGQRCTAARRLLVPNNNLGDDYLTLLLKAAQSLQVGPYDQTPEPFMGPVIRYEHALNHLAAQDQMIQAGGIPLLNMSLLTENTGFLSPGIIDMTPIAHPADQEIFAPLVSVYRYHDFDEALMLANQTQYGLSAGLFSNQALHYQQFYESVRAGIINWNRPTTGASSALPFGGIGRSGNHRPSAYFASDYCAYPIASIEDPVFSMPTEILPGIPPF